MTQVLEKAWNEVIHLPEDRQEFIAHLILNEIQDEEYWDVQFYESESKLADIAEKVRKDIRAGKIKKIGFGEL